VAELCESALIEKTKDLELAAIYTQAQTSMQGLAGLEAGLRLLQGLLQSFWDSIFPGFDEGEVIQAIRARPLSWLGTSKDFLSVVRRVPLSDPIGGQPRSWFDYEQAQRVDQASTKADQAAFQELIEAGYISIDDWHGSFNATPPERLVATIDGLRGCQTALRELSTQCDEIFTEGAPYFSDLANLLDEMQTMLEQFAGAGIASDTASGGEAAAGVPGGATPEAAGAAGPIASRDDAYRRLREVAEYLRKTEPHSPVPPLIDRAVRWGNMNFESLFNDVVKNQDVRSQTKELLGLEEPPA
jgi:type VI secretion system protein ImpA